MPIDLTQVETALAKLDALAGTETGAIAHDLRRIADIGKRNAAAVLAGEITPAEAAGNFADLAKASRAALQTQAIGLNTAQQGIQLMDIALTALRVAKVVL